MAPVTSVLRTLIDCARSHVAPDLVNQAYRRALHRGISRSEGVRSMRSSIASAAMRAPLVEGQGGRPAPDDAAKTTISANWGFGIDYNAALELCTILLHASGWRPEKTLHHDRTIQALPLNLGAARKHDADYALADTAVELALRVRQGAVGHLVVARRQEVA